MRRQQQQQGISVSFLQTRILWQHYRGNQPFTESYDKHLEELRNQLGWDRLKLALSVVPNNSKLPDAQLSKDLPIVDLFVARPELFEELDKDAQNTVSPEILYADGEKDVIWIDGKLYSYWKSSTEDYAPVIQQTISELPTNTTP